MGKKGYYAIVGVLGVAVLGWVAFGYLGIHTAFTDKTVSEAGPTFASTPDQSQSGADQKDGTNDTAGGQEDATSTTKTGDFTNAEKHDASGKVSVITNGTQTFLRFENLTADNGPDLKVYLRAESGEFISLGELKGNQGDQNYEIPAGTDLEVYSTVEIWCEDFSVSFGTAVLQDA